MAGLAGCLPRGVGSPRTNVIRRVGYSCVGRSPKPLHMHGALTALCGVCQLLCSSLCNSCSETCGAASSGLAHAGVCSRSEKNSRRTPAPRRRPQGFHGTYLASRRARAPAMGRQAGACSTYKAPVKLRMHRHSSLLPGRARWLEPARLKSRTRAAPEPRTSLGTPSPVLPLSHARRMTTPT